MREGRNYTLLTAKGNCSKNNMQEKLQRHGRMPIYGEDKTCVGEGPKDM